MGTSAEELRERLDAQRNDLSADLDAIGDRVSPGRIMERRKSAVKDRVGSVRERLMGAADTSSHAVGAAPAAMGDGVSRAVSHLGDQMAAAPTAATHAVQGNPLAMGLIAFGAGLVVASLLPETEAEHRAAARFQPALEEAAAGAAEMASNVAEEVRPAVEQAVTDLKATATESVQAVQSEAKEAATGTADAAKDGIASPSAGGGTGLA